MKLHLPVRLFRAIMALMSLLVTNAYANTVVTGDQSILNQDDVSYTSFTDNETKSSQNYNENVYVTAEGGAFHVKNGIFALKNNGNIVFSNNEARAYASSYYGYAQSSAYGGAIGLINAGLEICNNGIVTFSGNHAVATAHSVMMGKSQTAYGGAIYSTGSIKIEGNEQVVFRGNYEYVYSMVSAGSGSHVLRSIYMNADGSDDDLIIAAKTGGSVVFFDSVYMSYYSGAEAIFNKSYLDKNSLEQKATGDVIFSGSYTNDDIIAIGGKGDASGSKISTIDTTISLHGGSLQVVAGASLQGRGIEVVRNSDAVLLLRDGTLLCSGYDIVLNEDTSLHLENINVVKARKIIFNEDSNLKFSLNHSHVDTVALSVSGTLDIDGVITLDVSTDGVGLRDGGVYQLLYAAAYDETQWSESQINISSSSGLNITYNDLYWAGNTLYFKYSDSMLKAPLTIATWTNEAQNGLWNSTSLNWE